jgi:hypothetical protein
MQANIGYTNAEIAARSWSNGDVIFNLDTGKLELRSAGTWIDNPSTPSAPTPPTISSISTNTSLVYNTIYQVNCTSGDVTLTLPTAISNAGKEVSIVKTDSTGNIITVITTGGQTINNDVNLIIRHQNTFITIISNDTNFILS